MIIFAFFTLLSLTVAQSQLDYNDISDRTVVIRLEPPSRTPNFLRSMEPPKTVETPRPSSVPSQSNKQYIPPQQTFNNKMSSMENPINRRPNNQASVTLPPLVQNQPANQLQQRPNHINFNAAPPGK